jgi:hypothetical protein
VNIKTSPVTLPAGTHLSVLHPSFVVKEVSKPEGGASHQFSTSGVTDTSRGKEQSMALIEKLVQTVHESVPSDVVSSLKQLLMRYADVLSTSEYDLDLTDVITLRIDTADAKPVRQPLRRHPHPPAHVEAISEHVNKMLKQTAIEPATSLWASNVVLVRKQDSSYRCCIDYRQLNAVTTRDAYPLPRIHVYLDAMSNAKWFYDFRFATSSASWTL